MPAVTYQNLSLNANHARLFRAVVHSRMHEEDDIHYLNIRLITLIKQQCEKYCKAIFGNFDLKMIQGLFGQKAAELIRPVKFLNAQALVEKALAVKEAAEKPLDKAIDLLAFINCKFRELIKENLDIDMSSYPDEKADDSVLSPDSETEEASTPDNVEPATITKDSDYYYNTLLSIIESSDYKKCAAAIAKDKEAQAKYEEVAKGYLVQYKVIDKTEQPNRRYYYA